MEEEEYYDGKYDQMLEDDIQDRIDYGIYNISQVINDVRELAAHFEIEKEANELLEAIDVFKNKVIELVYGKVVTKFEETV